MAPFASALVLRVPRCIIWFGFFTVGLWWRNAIDSSLGRYVVRLHCRSRLWRHAILWRVCLNRVMLFYQVLPLLLSIVFYGRFGQTKIWSLKSYCCLSHLRISKPTRPSTFWLSARFHVSLPFEKSISPPLECCSHSYPHLDSCSRTCRAQVKVRTAAVCLQVKHLLRLKTPLKCDDYSKIVRQLSWDSKTSIIRLWRANLSL